MKGSKVKTGVILGKFLEAPAANPSNWWLVGCQEGNPYFFHIESVILEYKIILTIFVTHEYPNSCYVHIEVWSTLFNGLASVFLVHVVNTSLLYFNTDDL